MSRRVREGIRVRAEMRSCKRGVTRVVSCAGERKREWNIVEDVPREVVVHLVGRRRCLVPSLRDELELVVEEWRRDVVEWLELSYVPTSPWRAVMGGSGGCSPRVSE